MQMGAYLIAVEGTSLEAMYRAVKAYLQRNVKRETHAFAPSSADFGEQCRREQYGMEAATRPRIEVKQEPTPAPQVSPRKLKLLHEALQGNVEATEELKRMYPDLPVWRMADLPVSKLMESE